MIQVDVERYRFTTYEGLLKKTIEKCNQLQQKGNRIHGIQIDTYLPWYQNLSRRRSSGKYKNYSKNIYLNMALNVGAYALRATKEVSVVLIWYEPTNDVSFFSPITYTHATFLVNTHEKIGKYVSREMEMGMSQNKQLLSLNFDTYGSQNSSTGKEFETTAVTLFWNSKVLDEDR